MNRILKGLSPLIYGDGEQTRAFSYIEDVAPYIAEAPFIKEATNQIINLGSGKMYNINHLAEVVIESMKDPKIKSYHVPPRYEVKHAYSTTEKSEKILGFKESTPLKEGIRKMAEWAIKKGPRTPTIWSNYEIRKNLPDFWRNLEKDYKNAKTRKSP